MKLNLIDLTVLISLALIGIGLYKLQSNLVLIFLGLLGIVFARLMTRDEASQKENQ